MHGLVEDGVDGRHGLVVEPEVRNVGERGELVRPPRAPQRHAHARAVQQPAQRQVDDVLAETLLRQFVEAPDRVEILPEARLGELRIVLAQVVA